MCGPHSLRYCMLFVLLLASSSQAQDAKARHDAVTPAPRSGGWMKRHEAMNDRVKKGNVDLVFIGDSITQGWEGRGKNVRKTFYGKRNAVNLGIGGDRTQHIRGRGCQNRSTKKNHVCATH